MQSTAPAPFIETAVVAIAAASLGSAVGFAAWSVSPGNAAATAGAAAAMVAMTAAWAASKIDRGRPRRPDFAPAAFDDVDIEPLPDQPAEDDILELDTPLSDDSRVVRLFAPAASAGAEPGEMLARIEHFLGQAPGPAAEPIPLSERRGTEDASAALHAALADIRRSLRQG